MRISNALRRGLQAAMISGLWALAGTAAAQDYVRLISATPVLPPPSPLRSFQANPLGENFTGGLDLMNDMSTTFAVGEKLKAAAAVWLQEGQRLGQPGVLLKIRVAEIYVGSQRRVDLVGDGVSVIGVGASPQGVCFSVKCYNPADGEPRLNAGYRLTEESQYVWIQSFPALPSVYEITTYPIAGFEQYVRQIALNSKLASVFEEVVAAQQLHGYATRLTLAAEKAADRAQAKLLLDNREIALGQMRQIETNLAKERERAARVSKTKATFALLSQVFSVAANISLASAMVGQELAAANQSQLLSELGEMEKQSTQAIGHLSGQLNSLKDTINTQKTEILKLGTANGMSASDSGTFKIILH